MSISFLAERSSCTRHAGICLFEAAQLWVVQVCHGRDIPNYPLCTLLPEFCGNSAADAIESDQFVPIDCRFKMGLWCLGTNQRSEVGILQSRASSGAGGGCARRYQSAEGHGLEIKW